MLGASDWFITWNKNLIKQKAADVFEAWLEVLDVLLYEAAKLIEGLRGRGHRLVLVLNTLVRDAVLASHVLVDKTRSAGCWGSLPTNMS